MNMNLKNLTFEQWEKNHSSDHNDRWLRELYPFSVFARIDFAQGLLQTEQRIKYNRQDYCVMVKKIELQANDRYIATFDIDTFPNTKTQAWRQRRWTTTFKIIYTRDYEFITVFTERKDPSKDLLKRFLKGDFKRISEYKSIPVSELLSRTLILHIAEEGFPNGKHRELFRYVEGGNDGLQRTPQLRGNSEDVAPIYSLGRIIWICYAFNEEKAHRIALYNSFQCHKLIVVFCNPTYTRHERCTYSNTDVVSLYDFSNLVSGEVKRKYDDQIRFLQNHLYHLEESNIEVLLKEIDAPTRDIYNISKPLLMEAFGIMKIYPNDKKDFFYSLCAFNLINAFLNSQRPRKQVKIRGSRLFGNMYYFKSYLSDILTKRVQEKDFSIPMYVSNNLIMVEINGYQFSFYNVPLNQTLIDYQESTNNSLIEWSGKRLQPIAPLLLEYSRAIRKHQN